MPEPVARARLPSVRDAVEWLRRRFPGARVYAPRVRAWWIEGRFDHRGRRYRYRITRLGDGSVELEVEHA